MLRTSLHGLQQVVDLCHGICRSAFKVAVSIIVAARNCHLSGGKAAMLLPKWMRKMACCLIRSRCRNYMR